MFLTTVQVEDSEAKRIMEKVSARYGNLHPVLNAIGDEYTKRVDNRFVTETDPDGNRWQPTKVLSNYLGYVGTRKGYKRKEAYTESGRWRKSFARYLEGKKILQLTGALRGDIHYQVNGDTSVTIGTTGRIPYAAIQQFGGMAGRGKKVKIPARPYLARNAPGGGLELATADREMVLGKLTAYLDTGKD
jgi:phage gpG-like protein